MDKNKKSLFPSDFLWGGSTAAHQVEGGNHNQWTVWELEHAQELAQSAQKQLGHLQNWHAIKAEAQNPSNYISGEGVNHFKNYEQDFDLLKKLNFNSFRFTVEWSRIEPEEGEWNQAAINHYKRYIEALKERGITPLLNIWHWTVPVWFAEKGGFEQGKNLVYFDRFVRVVADELLGGVDYLATLNEPNVYASKSYLTGEWPPQKKSLVSFGKVYWNLAKAHNRAYKILKQKKPTLRIGIAMQLANIQAKRPHNLFDQISTKYMRVFWNWWFLKRIKKYQDFIGINYYFTDYYTGVGKRQNPTVPLNDLGWYMEPEGLYPLLVRTWIRFKKPILITENGVADADDAYRQWWIQESIIAMERALSEGVDIKGYFHWSLLDNFEWAYGWWPKFGLIEVDRKNGMKRHIRPSAKWLAELISKDS